MRGVPRNLRSIQGFLGSPSQSFKVGIFSLRRRGPGGLLRLALYAAGFLLPLLYLFGLFSIAFGDSGLACSCDGFLLLFAPSGDGRIDQPCYVPDGRRAVRVALVRPWGRA